MTIAVHMDVCDNYKISWKDLRALFEMQDIADQFIISFYGEALRLIYEALAGSILEH